MAEEKRGGFFDSIFNLGFYLALGYILFLVLQKMREENGSRACCEFESLDEPEPRPSAAALARAPDSHSEPEPDPEPEMEPEPTAGDADSLKVDKKAAKKTKPRPAKKRTKN